MFERGLRIFPEFLAVFLPLLEPVLQDLDGVEGIIIKRNRSGCLQDLKDTRRARVFVVALVR